MTQAAPPGYQVGWWVDPAKPGIGVIIALEAGAADDESLDRNEVRALFYLYDAVGNPTWYYLSGKISDRTLSTPVLQPTGPPAVMAWDPEKLKTAKVGQATLSLAGPRRIEFRYQFTLHGIQVNDTLHLQPFGMTTPSGPGPAPKLD